MKGWIDKAIFPWHDKEAAQFHAYIAETYPDVNDIKNIVAQLGLKLHGIDFKQKSSHIWHDILNRLANIGHVQSLVDFAERPASKVAKEVKAMRRFEYTSLHEQHIALMQKLEGLSREGWDAFSIIQQAHRDGVDLPYYVAHLKRELGDK